MSALAPVKPYFKYSMDMRASLPVIAYYSQLFAVQNGLKIMKAQPDLSPEQKKFLMSEMETLEKMKGGLPEGTTKEEQRYVVEAFVTSTFTNADKDERTCETITKKNAQDFHFCGHMISLMGIFGPEAIEEGGWDEKKKYCQFKAATIIKAMKVGEQPPRGNPNDPNNTGEREMPEEEKMPEIPSVPIDDGPKIPDMDDLEAQLAALTAADSGASQPPASSAPFMPPPMPESDFSHFDPQSYQPDVKAAPVYQPPVQPAMPPPQPIGGMAG
jgi:vacuolar protein sorting-associated protein VTA1